MELNKYSYYELFILIKTQTDKENERKKKKPEKKIDDLLNQGLRMLYNPTLDNLDNTFKTIIPPKEEEKPDDRSKYIYRSSSLI